jgi:hypothetical protein
MESGEKLGTDKWEEMMNQWNYDTYCTLISLPVSELKTFKRLISFVLKFFVKCELN